MWILPENARLLVGKRLETGCGACVLFGNIVQYVSWELSRPFRVLSLRGERAGGGAMARMEYKIGDVSRLLGLTPEAIRYYEDQGIITPRKETKTGYRYYNVWDIHILILARCYRQYGFSLAETAGLLNQSDGGEVIGHLEEREAELERQIMECSRLLRHIREKKAEIGRAEEQMGEFRIESSPEIYRLDTEKNYCLYDNEEAMALMRTWINRAPFVFPSGLFRREVVEAGGGEYSFGLGVEQQYAGELGLQKSRFITHHPTRLSVFTAFSSNSEKVLSAGSLEPALDYMARQGLKLSGDVLTRVVLMRKGGGRYINQHQVWLPFA
jgi:DNA-binding transcriptional MerR regulator